MQDFSQVEKDLWEAADQLRANSNLASSEYFMPLLGVIFLRHATNRFDAVTRQIAEDQAAGRMPKRKLIQSDYVRRRALWLPPSARFDHIISLPTGSNWGQALINAMEAIEKDFDPLGGVLPKDYTRFGNDFLEELLKIFNRDSIRTASGDVFGRIYEYFLMKFADQKAHDDGEFFTPPSIVQVIVNVIEPEHGTVLDPACGSGGMFVQSSHFMEDHGLDTAKRVVFYGQEKTATTIRLAKMNLAVHGLEGDIKEANTFYQDEHTLAGKCDFVMANPPFNVDMVDAEKIEGDKRLPFGLPGVNKGKKVSNGNYLWISYFHSYLNEKGRAGFVMSSQASSAGHGEKDVRRKLVQTGDVDVMIAIRSNFFYTRTVPCELWFFDKGKPKTRRDQVLMLDARGVFRKVTRKIYDFSPEQLANLTAIVWLYRGQGDRFLDLVRSHLDSFAFQAGVAVQYLADFDELLTFAVASIQGFVRCFVNRSEETPSLQLPAQLVRDAAEEFLQVRFMKPDPEGPRAALKLLGNLPELEAKAKTIEGMIEGLSEIFSLQRQLKSKLEEYMAARAELWDSLAEPHQWLDKHAPTSNDQLHKACRRFEQNVAQIHTAVKDIQHLGKLVRQIIELAETKLQGRKHPSWNKAVSALHRIFLPEATASAVDRLKKAEHFHRQAKWLQDRFPDAELVDVPGLAKVVTRAEIEASDWSLTPGRYVGVAPAEVDEDFDFEQAISDIHVELADLNTEAAKLAKTIQANFEELGI